MINKLNEYEFKLSAYALALSTLNFDSMTVAPKLGNNYRNERMGYLSGEYYKILTDGEFIKLLNELNLQEDLDKITKRKVKLYLKNLETALALTKEEYMEFNKLKMDAYDAWEEARAENNYKIFEPFLIKLIETSKKVALKRNQKIEPYNLLLSDFEEGMDIEKYDQFFNLIKERIVPLIKKIVANEYQIEEAFLNEKYDVNTQKEFVKDILQYLNFDKSFSHCSISTHPFSSGFSKNDVRVTTRYNEKMLTDSIFSIIHEVGHATFEHQVNEQFDGSIIASAITMGVHESQSRLFENCLGRSKAFWEYNYPILQEKFDKLNGVTLDDFVKAINVSKPSLIRTDADELTYPLHILLRYEIEKGIFDGSIDVYNLREVWNSKTEELLGIKVLNDKVGILQDIHWSDASFGYFPAYALGSAYAAQIYRQMKKELNVDGLLKNNQFEEINKWLKEKIHDSGALYTPQEKLLYATNEEFNPVYYIDYLENKFKKLYKIK